MSRRKLPKYALGIPRNRLVEMLCRGNCNCERLAKIADTPNSKGGTEIDIYGYAECLRCGYRGTDYSNWKRVH